MNIVNIVERRHRYLSKEHAGHHTRKTCKKCGETGYYHERSRRCMELVGMLGTYICGGRLVKYKKPRKVKPEYVSDAARVRASAEKELAHAQRMVAKKRDDMLRLAQQSVRCGQAIAKWERRQNIYARKARLTDAELRSEIDARIQRKAARAAAAPVTRAMKLEGDL